MTSEPDARKILQLVNEQLRNGRQSDDPAALTSVLGEVRTHRKKLDDRIMELNAELVVARSQRTQWTKLEHKVASLFSPIWKLPTDLLEHLFGFCAMDAVSSLDDLSSPSIPTIVLALSQVCRHWRAISLECKALWTTLTLNLACRSLEQRTRLTELLKTLLARSADLPLYVYYVDTGEAVKPCPVLVKLMSVATRWKAAVLDVGNSSNAFDGDVLSPLSNRLPLLESIRFCGPETTQWNMFEATPKLRHLTLKRCDTPMFHVNWSQLEYVTLEDGNYTDLMHVLNSAENLVSLSLCIPKSVHANARRISLSLKKLSVTACFTSHTDTATNSIFDTFLFANLEELRLYGKSDTVSNDTTQIFPGIPDFITTSGCTIRELHLEGLQIPESSLLSLLFLLHGLEDLHYHHRDFNVTSILPLLTTDRSSVLLPKLKNLCMVSSGLGLDVHRQRECLDALSSRWLSAAWDSCVSQLTHVSLFIGLTEEFTFSASSLEQFKTLRKLGMNLKVRDSSGYIKLELS